MSEITTYVKQIQSEFRTDSERKVFVSIRGAARLADVDHKALITAFQSGEQKPSQLAEFLIQQGFEGGDLLGYLFSV